MSRSKRSRSVAPRQIPYWRRMRHDEDLTRIMGCEFVVVEPDGEGKLLAHDHTWWGGLALREWRTSRPWWTTRTWLWRRTNLQHHLRPEDRVCSAPRWSSPAPWRCVRRALALLAAASVAWLAHFSVGEWAFTLIVFVLGALFLDARLPTFGVPRMQSLAALPLDGHAAIEYAANRLAGVHPEALEEMPRRARVMERIDDVRTRYAELREDVVLRIDQPALFDAAAPPTADLLAAFVLADDLDDDTPLAEVERVAGEVEIAFATARRHAERVGIDHLPEASRGDARRASKTARLARDGATEGERRAAREQLGRILEAMGLPHLPSPKEIRAIEG